MTTKNNNNDIEEAATGTPVVYLENPGSNGNDSDEYVESAVMTKDDDRDDDDGPSDNWEEEEDWESEEDFVEVAEAQVVTAEVEIIDEEDDKLKWKEEPQEEAAMITSAETSADAKRKKKMVLIGLVLFVLVLVVVAIVLGVVFGTTKKKDTNSNGTLPTSSPKDVICLDQDLLKNDNNSTNLVKEEFAYSMTIKSDGSATTTTGESIATGGDTTLLQQAFQKAYKDAYYESKKNSNSSTTTDPCLYPKVSQVKLVQVPQQQLSSQRSSTEVVKEDTGSRRRRSRRRNRNIRSLQQQQDQIPPATVETVITCIVTVIQYTNPTTSPNSEEQLESLSQFLDEHYPEIFIQSFNQVLESSPCGCAVQTIQPEIRPIGASLECLVLLQHHNGGCDYSATRLGWTSPPEGSGASAGIPKPRYDLTIVEGQPSCIETLEQASKEYYCPYHITPNTTAEVPTTETIPCSDDANCAFVMGAIDPVFPPSTRALLNIPESCQSKARKWLSQSNKTKELSIHRIRQRYALAVYHCELYRDSGFDDSAESGDSSSADNDSTTMGTTYYSSWLSHDVHECDWETPVGTMEPCNQNKEYRVLYSFGDEHTRKRRRRGGNRLPAELSMITSLEKLLLPDCQLVGTIPPEYNLLSRLDTLDLSNNYLSGPCPNLIWEFQNLVDLDLTDNRLSGTIPEKLNLWEPNLKRLALGSNNFYGTLPQTALAFLELMELDCSENYFTGTIPSEINTKQMKLLYLDTNDFTGSFPVSAYADGAANELVELTLYDNEIEGDLDGICYLFDTGSLQECKVDISKVSCVCCSNGPNVHGDLVVATTTDEDTNKDPAGPWDIFPVYQLGHETRFNAIVIQTDWHVKRPKELSLNACDTSICDWSHQLGGGDSLTCNTDIHDFLAHGPSKKCELETPSYSMCVLPREYDVADIECFDLEILNPGGKPDYTTDKVLRNGAWFVLTDRLPTISDALVVAKSTHDDGNEEPTGPWEMLPITQLAHHQTSFNAIVIETDWHIKRPRDLSLNACDTSVCKWSHQFKGGAEGLTCNTDIDDFLRSHGPSKQCGLETPSFSMCVLPRQYDISDIDCFDLEILNPGGELDYATDMVLRNGVWFVLTDRQPTLSDAVVVATTADDDRNRDPTGPWDIFPVTQLGEPKAFNAIVIQTDWHVKRPNELSLNACDSSVCNWTHQLGGGGSLTCNTDIYDFLAHGPNKKCGLETPSYSMCVLPREYDISDIECFDLEILSPGGKLDYTTDVVLRNDAWFVLADRPPTISDALVVAKSTYNDGNEEPTGPWEMLPITQLAHQQTSFNAIVIETDWHTKRPKDLSLNACDTSVCKWTHQFKGEAEGETCNTDIYDFLSQGPSKQCGEETPSFSMCVLQREYDISDIDCFDLEIVSPGGELGSPTDVIHRNGVWFVLADRPPTLSDALVVATTADDDPNQDPTGPWHILPVDQLVSPEKGPVLFNTVIVQSDWHIKRPSALRLNACDTSMCEWTHPFGGHESFNCNLDVYDYLQNGPNKECQAPPLPLYDISGTWSFPGVYNIVISQHGNKLTATWADGGWDAGSYQSGEVVMNFRTATGSYETGDQVVMNFDNGNTVKGKITESGEKIEWDNGTTWTRQDDISGTWGYRGVYDIEISQHGNKLTATWADGGWETATGSYQSGDQVVMTFDNGNTVKGKITESGDKIEWDNGTTWTRSQEPPPSVGQNPHNGGSLSSFSMCRLPNQYDISDIECFDLQIESAGGRIDYTTDVLLRDAVWFAMVNPPFKVVGTSANEDTNEDPTGRWNLFPVEQLERQDSQQAFFNTIVIESDWHIKRPSALHLNACGVSVCEWTHPFGGHESFNCNEDVNDYLQNGPNKHHSLCVSFPSSLSCQKLDASTLKLKVRVVESITPLMLSIGMVHGL